jgi:hypothetical protein
MARGLDHGRNREGGSKKDAVVVLHRCQVKLELTLKEVGWAEGVEGDLRIFFFLAKSSRERRG